MSDESEYTLREEVRRLHQKLAEKEVELTLVRRSERKYRHLFEESPTMIYVIDKMGEFVNINAAGATMLGFKNSSEVVGKRLEDFFLINRQKLKLYGDLLEHSGSIKDFDAKMRRVDGTIREVQFSAALRTTLSGKVRGYEGFVIDITTRKEAEQRLLESEIKYKTVLDNSLAAIYMFQNGGYFSYVNPRMVRLLGYDSEDEIIGKGFWEIIASSDHDMVKARGLAREKREISPQRYKYRMVKKNGEEIWVDMRASHAPYLGKPAAVGNFIDITREVKAKERIRHLTRRLIGGIEEERRALANDIHDEFGQLLTLLQFDVESLQNALPPGTAEATKKCGKVMEQIQNLAEKMRATTSRLRPDVLDHLGLVPTLEWYIEDIKNRRNDLQIAFQAIGLKKRLPPAVELVLYRVFQEGLNNVTKHSGASNVSIQLTYNHPDIIFMIRDDGCGFAVGDEGVPVDTPGKSIGLLSMQERVSSLHGDMSIRSTVGKGTVLRIKIPMDEKQDREAN
ncbi:MAG: PAS domain-containing sensor histidine kinase [Desulforhopalus sp.]